MFSVKQLANDLKGVVIGDENFCVKGVCDIEEGKIDGFNVGQNIGSAAGQTIMWPHVHLIPRHENDCDPEIHNGIRRSHPNGDYKNYY